MVEHSGDYDAEFIQIRDAKIAAIGDGKWGDVQNSISGFVTLYSPHEELPIRNSAFNNSNGSASVYKMNMTD